MYVVCLSYFTKRYDLTDFYIVTNLDSRLIDIVHRWLTDYSSNYDSNAEALFKAFGDVVGHIVKSGGKIDAIYSGTVPEYKEFDIEDKFKDNMIYLFFDHNEIQIALDKFDDYMSQDEFIATRKTTVEHKGGDTMLPGSLYFDIRGNE